MPDQTNIVTVNRLAPEVYKDLEKKLPPIAVNNETSPMQAGFQLGVQTVLKMLREGFVTGT